MATLWWNPTELVPGDASLQIQSSPPGDPGVVIRSQSTGLKWAHLALHLSNEVVINQVILSYQVTSSTTYIDGWRLLDLGVPGEIVTLFSDLTALASLAPTRYQKQVGAIRPVNGVTLALQLNFQSPLHRIKIGAIGLVLDSRRTVIDLATAGDATTLPAAQVTFSQALLGVQSSGGGIVALTPGTVAGLAVSESQDGAAVLDARGGPIRLQLAQQTEPISGSGNYPEGGVILRHSTETPYKHLYGAYYAQAILQRTIHGASSVRTRVTRPTGMGLDAQFYPASIENFFAGQSFNINDGSTSYLVKSIGWDAALMEPYFTADVDQTVASDALLGSKHNIGVLALTSENHCSNQGSALLIQKFAYGPGDAFGCTLALNYLGNIMSAEGDEGGVGYTAEIVHDVRNFRGKVGTFDASTGRLSYVQGHNTERFGTGLPLINLNEQKWTTAGKVRIYITTTYPNQSLALQHGVIQGIGTQWGPEVVGRYFAVDTPAEYLDPGDATYTLPPEQRIYLWYRIMKYMLDPTDGSQLIFVRKIIWGTQVGAPNLMNSASYFNYNPNATLDYIIAPGAIVAEVSEAVNENDGNIVSTTLVLQPNADFTNPQYAFALDDEIEQAIGAQPLNPVGFRARHFNNIPALMPDASFEGINWGTAPVGAGFRIHGVDGLDASAQRYPRGEVAFQAGIILGASMNRGIVLQGDLKYPDDDTLLLGTNVHDVGLGLCFMQQGRDFNPASPHNKKAIVWSTESPSTFAALGFDPATREYYLRGGRVRVEGLAASTTGPSHLRGIAAPIVGGATSHVVILDPSIAEPDNVYAIQVTPSWITQLAVTDKTTTSFTVHFGTPAPAGGTIDWFLVR